jgi:MFS family permease
LVPLVIADVTKGSGHFNLAQGFVATAVGIGAALSTTIFGYLIDNFGYVFVFVALAAIGLLGVSLVAAVMPETRSLPSPHPEVS